MSDFFFALENANWPALLIDSAANIRIANKAARQLFGTSLDLRPSLAKSIWAKDNEISPEQFIKESEKKTALETTLRFKAKDGSISPFRVNLCVSDFEEEKFFTFQIFKPAEVPAAPQEPASPPPPVANHQPQAPGPASNGAVNSVEAGLALKQKLDCALQLTRTVALDFNNALTTILGHTSLLLSKLEPGQPFRNSLVEIEKSAEKAAEIAHDLAAFSRQEKDTKAAQSSNVNEMVRRTVEIFRGSNADRVDWKLELENRLFTCAFDEAKMQQAFVKVIENSVQAIAGQGFVAVRTKNISLTETIQDGSANLQPGNYVQIEIADSGQGIPPEVLPRIFEPFFTTKKEKGHRGLGLAWVYGIVTNHGGSVAVTSQPGSGTEVRVYLPAQKKLIKDRSLKGDDLSGNQTILMVDDEDLLLTMGEMVLSSFGYNVITANTGQKAVEIFAKKAEQIDLVVTDLVMPQMSGREVIEKLRKIKPEVKIICASGYMRTAGAEDEEIYLQKPFATQELLRTVKEVLGVDQEKS